MKAGHGLAAIRRMLRRKRLWIWAAVALAFGLAVGQLPLFGVLGYELALAAAPLGAICGLDLGAALARELQGLKLRTIERPTYPGRTLAATALASAIVAVAIMLVPAVVCAIRGLWVPTCDWGFGLHAYVA